MKKCLNFLKAFVILLLTPLLITQTYAANKRLHKKVKQAATKIVQREPEDNSIESITVDCAFSIGGYCNCARYLENNGLRRTASPIDWMRGYSLHTAAYLFETKFKDFFTNVKVTEEKNGWKNRTVYDTKNHIESIHYMPPAIPFDQAYAEFKETMSRRAQKIDNVLSHSKSVLLVSSRHKSHNSYVNDTDNQLKDFAQRFSKVYPNLKKIYLINMYNDNNMKTRKRIVYKDKKIKIIQYKFSDTGFSDWLGNKAAWNEIMGHIHLTDKVQEDNGIHDTKY